MKEDLGLNSQFGKKDSATKKKLKITDLVQSFVLEMRNKFLEDHRDYAHRWSTMDPWLRSISKLWLSFYHAVLPVACMAHSLDDQPGWRTQQISMGSCQLTHNCSVSHYRIGRRSPGRIWWGQMKKINYKEWHQYNGDGEWDVSCCAGTMASVQRWAWILVRSTFP